MAVKNLGDGIVTKLAADAKPTTTDYPAGTILRNTDDYKRWINSGTDWISQELNTYRRFRCQKEGTIYYFLDQNGKVEASGSDFDDIFQAILDAMPTVNTYEFNFDTGTFTVNEPIIIPSSPSNAVSTKKIIINGQFHYGRHGNAVSTVFRPSTAFPDDRYIIECNNAVASNTSCILTINGLCMTNSDNLGTKDIGFIKLQNDNNQDRTYDIQNIYSQYCWRTLHLIGGIWWSRFVNINAADSNDTFIGDADIILEWGSAAGSGNPTPKYNYFENNSMIHQGQMNNFVRIENGSYNNFNFTTADAAKCAVAGIELSQNTNSAMAVNNNVFYNTHVLDVSTVPTPDTRQAGIYLNGQYVQNNWFYGCFVNKIINHYKITNGANRNFILSTGHWGSAILANSTGAGVGNTLEIAAGSTATDSAVTDTGGLLRIIDKRRGGENSGFTSVADGGTITHGLFTTPVWIIAVASVAGEMASVTAKSTTTFTVALKKYDNSAGTTQSVYWRAGVYA